MTAAEMVQAMKATKDQNDRITEIACQMVLFLREAGVKMLSREEAEAFIEIAGGYMTPGFWVKGLRCIWADQSLYTEFFVVVLMHEVCHFVLDHGGSYGKVHACRMEFEAELLCCMTLEKLGISSISRSSNYIQNLSHFTLESIPKAVWEKFEYLSTTMADAFAPEKVNITETTVTLV